MLEWNFWSTVYKIQTIATNASQNFAVHHSGELNQSSRGDIAGKTYNAKLLVEIWALNYVQNY